MRATILFCGLLLFAPSSTLAELYQWTDTDGVIHVVDEAVEIPAAYRDQVNVYQSIKTAPPPASLPLSPSRAYPEHSQGQFAQKLALDLGLIKSSREDGLGPLSGAGIQPAGGWKVSDPLTPEVVYDVLAAARRAADSRRLSLSADGAEAVVRQVAAAVFPPSPVAEERETEEAPQEPQVVIYESPTQIIEVERDRYYDPYYGSVFVPVPVVPRGHSHHHRRRDRHDDRPRGPFAPSEPTGPHTSNWDQPMPRNRHSPSGPHTTNPIPSHSPSQMPFGSVSQMPFGSVSQMPFGTSPRSFGSSPRSFGSSPRSFGSSPRSFGSSGRATRR
jgi:hypothetical protein